MGQGAKPNTHIQWLMAISLFFLRHCFGSLVKLFEHLVFSVISLNGLYLFMFSIMVISFSLKLKSSPFPLR